LVARFLTFALQLDHGTYQTLKGPLLVNHREMWRAILANDKPAMRRATSALGVEEKYWRFMTLVFSFSAADLPANMGDMMQKLEKMPHADREAAIRKQLGLEDAGPSDHARVLESMPRELILLLKTNNLLRFAN